MCTETKENTSERNISVDTEINNPANSDANNSVSPENSKNDDFKKVPNMFHWWFGSIFLTFFPTLAAVVMDFAYRKSIDFAAIVSDGELVLCSFLISAGAAWSNYEASSMNKEVPKAQTFYFYILSTIAFLELITYSSVKLSAENPENSPFFVCGISVIWICLSVFLAWRNKRLLT